MAARALVWDMDGTLLDSSAAVPAAFADAVRLLGGPVVSPAQVIAAYSLGTPDVIMAYLAGRPATDSEMEAYYRALDRAQCEPYPGIAATLDELRRRGQPVAVFTGASSRAAAILLAGAGLSADVVVGGDQIRHPKPAADGLLRAAELIGVRPRDIAYIGDAPADLGAARAAGSHGAAAAWGHLYDPAEPAHSVLIRPAEALTLLAPDESRPPRRGLRPDGSRPPMAGRPPLGG